MPIKTDATSPIGRSWKETFQCDTQKEAESAMKQLGMTWHWMEDGSVSTKTKALPAVRQAPMSHRKSFFNSIVAAYFGWDDARNCGKQAVTLADGRCFPDDLMQKIKHMMDDSSVVIPWQAGDVLWLNNWTVMHARQSFEGERKVYASISP